MRIAFAGTPEFAATILRGLLGANLIPNLVLTQPDRPSGRGRKLLPSPVKQVALEHELQMQQPARLRGNKAADALSEVLSVPMDVLIVAAYGLILPKPMLDHPTHGALNVHASLLPRWRGAAPVERAILAGDDVSGVTLMQMDEGLDTGHMIAAARCPIGPETTGLALTEEIAELGLEVLLDALPRIADLPRTPQDEGQACYAPKLGAEEAEINWHRDALEIDRQVRALTGRQTAFTYVQADDHPIRMRILQASPQSESAGSPGTVTHRGRGLSVACGSGSLNLETVQLATGKGRPMDAKAARNGYPELLAAGRVLG